MPAPEAPDGRAERERVRRVYRDYIPTVGRWGAANRGNVAMDRERDAAVAARLRPLQPLGERRVLDLGCGMGAHLGALIARGSHPSRTVGVDLLPERLAVACRQQPGTPLVCGDAAHLGLRDGAFDLVLAFTLFSSILDGATRTAIAREIARVLRPGGLVLWYDLRFDSPANPNVRGLPLREVRELFPGFRPSLTTLTLLPPLARRLGPLTRPLYPVLARLPFLRSHLFGVLQAPWAP
ncbi:MAG: class I SAM-dependent methyltransferase [Acidobacteriota bacterium]